MMPEKVPRAAFAVAAGLLLIDAALLLVHLMSARLGASHLDPAWLVVHKWRVDADRGVAEMVQYLKLGLLVFGSLILFRRGNRGMLAFAVLFGILLLDDWLQGHEQFGSFLADNIGLGSVAGRAPHDLGELVAWLLMACIFLGLLLAALGSARSALSVGPAGRRTNVTLTILVGCLALFGVVIDAVAGLLQGTSIRELGGIVLGSTPAIVSDLAGATASHVPGIFAMMTSLGELLTAEPFVRAVTDLRNNKVVWTLVEEGGEMVTLTVMVTYLWSQALLGRLVVGSRRETLPSPTPRRRRSLL